MPDEMKQIPFIAKDLTDGLRKFLYCCAFWTVAADEELKSAEQQWLVDQFGQDGATESLSHFVNLESDAFFRAFDAAASTLTDDERRKVYPYLEDWLLQCADVDGVQDVSEIQIINKIKGRLNLDYEIKRLFESKSESDSGSNAEAFILEGHKSGIVSVSVIGDFIVSGSEDGEVRVWDAGSRECVKVIEKHAGGVMTLRPLPDRMQMLSGGRYGEVSLWNVADGSDVWTKQYRRMGGVMDADVDVAAGQIICVTNVGVAVSQDLATGAITSEFDDRGRGALRGVRFIGDGKVAVAGDYDTIRLWDLKGGKPMTQLRGHDEGILCVDISPDRKTLASASRDYSVRLWDIESGECRLTLEGHKFSVYGADFDADGSRLLSVSWDHSMRVWDTASGKMLVKMESSTDLFSDGAFDKTGRLVVGASSEKVLYVVPLK